MAEASALLATEEADISSILETHGAQGQGLSPARSLPLSLPLALSCPPF